VLVRGGVEHHIGLVPLEDLAQPALVADVGEIGSALSSDDTTSNSRCRRGRAAAGGRAGTARLARVSLPIDPPAPVTRTFGAFE